MIQDSNLNAMAINDIENNTLIERKTSGRRVLRFIPEVTADNLPSRIRLEPRNVGKEVYYSNPLSPQENAAQFAVNKIVSGLNISFQIHFEMLTSYIDRFSYYIIYDFLISS